MKTTDDSILFDGSRMKTDDFNLDKPVTIYLLRKATEWEIKQYEEIDWDKVSPIDDYTVDTE